MELVCVRFVDRYLSFFLLTIVLSVLRFMDSDYPFGTFKILLQTVIFNRLSKALQTRNPKMSEKYIIDITVYSFQRVVKLVNSTVH